MLPPSIHILSLDETEIREEIPETGSTLSENAQQKANYVYEKTGVNCFADDTGLEVKALNNEPGVYTARYAGPEKDSTKNMEKLLEVLKPFNNRNAVFKTVIALNIDGEMHTFEGAVNGKIATKISDNNGFGYDPVFIPENYSSTFSEMSAEEKNKISHRARALQEMIAYLTTYFF